MFSSDVILVSSYLRCVSVCVHAQDGRAEVVANDAGDRITPAVVAYRDDEQVFPHVSSSHTRFLIALHYQSIVA